MTTSSPKQSFQWNNLTILRSQMRTKLLLAFMIVLVVPLVSMEVVRRRQNKSLLVDQAISQRVAIRDAKASRLEKFFDDTTGQVRAFSNTSLIHDAMKELPAAFTTARRDNNVSTNEIRGLRSSVRSFYDRAFTRTYQDKNSQLSPPLDDIMSEWDEDAVYLQYLYIQDGAHSLGTNELLDRARDRSNYTKLHARFHPQIRHCKQKYNYGNILLCDPSGRVVYSVRKTLDFGTSLTAPGKSTSHLAEAFRRASEASSADDVVFSTFATDTARYEQVTGYALSPIIENGKTIGVAAFEIPIDRISSIVQENGGAGTTAETYVVGPDKLFRTDSRFLKQLEVPSAIMNSDVVVDTAATRDAQAGQASANVIDGYLGTKTISAWKPLNIPTGSTSPFHWTLVSDVSLDEVLSPAQSGSLLTTMALPVALSFIAAVVAVLLLVRPWINQAEQIVTALAEVTAGKSNARAEIVTGDEFGIVAESLNSWLDTALPQLTAQPTEWNAFDPVVASAPTTDLFPSAATVQKEPIDIGAPALAVDHTSEQLQHVVLEMQNTAFEVSRCAKQIQTATESLATESNTQSSQIVDTSMAIDEMVESIHQVAESTTKSASVADKARQTATNGSQAVLNTIKGMDRIRSQVQSTSKRIKRLGESSQEIGEIVQLISDVADRTSILALNASVQAAMAGDAGHGFQVVAEEVDRLSKRCNDATKHIARLVKCIQTETSEAIIGMEESTVEVVEGSKLASQAGESLADMDTVSNRLAELIDSISGAAKQQARSGILVSRSIKEVSSVMHTTASGTKQTEQMVTQLAARVEELRSSIARLMPKTMQTPVHAPVLNEPASDASLLGAATGTAASGMNADSVS